jgi:hypothetical protein
MTHIKVSTIVLALLICLGCKKAAPHCQSEIFLGEDCEKYSQCIYPQFDISGEPLAWYSATVEGQSTSMAGERNGMGYIAGQKQVILTTDPSITTGSSSGERFFSFRFWPTLQHEFTEKLPGILRFWFNFQAEIHDGDMPISRPGPFFTYVENGKAKRYVDIQK